MFIIGNDENTSLLYTTELLLNKLIKTLKFIILNLLGFSTLCKKPFK